MSRLSEEIILWCSWEFKFIELDDAFTTGSSIMPQKKNPDVTELIRGKTGRVYGDLNTLLVMMKGLPLAYNKDMQEDKEAIFDAVDTLELCLKTITPMLDTMKTLPANMRRAAAKGFINATDCADYLTKKGMPFRDAYKLTGCMVSDCIAADKTLEELTLTQFQTYSPLFGADIYDAIDLVHCCEGRTSYGGPSAASVAAPDRAGNGTAGRMGGGKRMKVKVFIDGSSGTTGLRIADRLAARPEIELLSISAEGRKDVHERAKVINSADLAFLCLPDAASKEVMPLLRPDVKVLDTSTAFRTDAAWDYGFPELKGQKEKIQNSYRVAVPGCYASGFISIARPLVELGLVRKGLPLQLHRHLRLLRRRQKDDRGLRKPRPPGAQQAGCAQELRPEPWPQAPAGDAEDQRPCAHADVRAGGVRLLLRDAGAGAAGSYPCGHYRRGRGCRPCGLLQGRRHRQGARPERAAAGKRPVLQCHGGHRPHGAVPDRERRRRSDDAGLAV